MLGSSLGTLEATHSRINVCKHQCPSTEEEDARKGGAGEGAVMAVRGEAGRYPQSSLLGPPASNAVSEQEDPGIRPMPGSDKGGNGTPATPVPLDSWSDAEVQGSPGSSEKTKRCC